MWTYIIIGVLVVLVISRFFKSDTNGFNNVSIVDLSNYLKDKTLFFWMYEQKEKPIKVKLANQ